MTVDDLLAAAAPGLHEVVLNQMPGGWQAIVKTKAAVNGPWSVGCDPDPAAALRKALDGVQPEPAIEDIFG